MDRIASLSAQNANITPSLYATKANVWPRAPDAPIQDIPPPAIQPTTNIPDACLNARDLPFPAVNIDVTYEVFHSRPPWNATFRAPQGLFSSKTLVELKTQLPLNFEDRETILSFTLIGPRLTSDRPCWNYRIKDADEPGFSRLKQAFQRIIYQCLAEHKATQEPFCFDFHIEQVGSSSK